MLKLKSIILVTALFLLSANAILAGDQNLEAKMTEQQKALQAELEHDLVAPCCWNMTVDQHESGAAREVRQKVAELVLAGKSKDDILDYFSSPAQYGERILATPSQKTLLGKSAYWLIPIMLFFGAVVVFFTIRNLSSSKSSQPGQKTNSAKTARDSGWSDKVEEELSTLDS